MQMMLIVMAVSFLTGCSATRFVQDIYVKDGDLAVKYCLLEGGETWPDKCWTEHSALPKGPAR